MNYKVVGTWQTLVPETYKVGTRVNVGPGAHFKGICDGHFCTMNSSLASATKTVWIGDIADLHRVLEASPAIVVMFNTFFYLNPFCRI